MNTILSFRKLAGLIAKPSKLLIFFLLFSQNNWSALLCDGGFIGLEFNIRKNLSGVYVVSKLAKPLVGRP